MRAVENAVFGWMPRRAPLVVRARVRLAGGWKGGGIGFRGAAIDRGELRLFHPATGRHRVPGAVLARLRRIVGDGLRGSRRARAGEVSPRKERDATEHVRARTRDG